MGKFKASLMRKNGRKNFILSVVALIEILAILIVSTYAWVETVSSIKISGEGTIDTYVFTDAEIGSGKGTIDLAGYFKQSGDMHLAPASSSDGVTMFFPQTASTTAYRKGNVSDKNTTYLSATFRIKTDTNADFYFTKDPTFSALGTDIRVSVTSQSEGTNETPVTKIFGKSKSTNAVVNTTSGGTGTANVEAFSDHIKGKSSTARLFSVGADETKVVTVNLWLQKKSTDMNSVMSQNITITDLGIISSLTPRRVSLVPGSVWDVASPTYYAWCWEGGSNNPDRFYKLTDNGDGSYSFDYNGTYQKLSFIRAKSGLTTDTPDWDSEVWNQTVDLTVPASPVDPTFFITAMGSGKNTSTGIWEEPAVVKVSYVTGNESFGTVKVTYNGYTATGNGQEAQILARGGGTISLTATAKNSNYQFLGWYEDAEGATKLSTTPTKAPAKGKEVTYYAKFGEVRTITLLQYIDGSNKSGAGTIKIDSDVSGTGTSVKKTVEKGTKVTLSATANTGYTLSGIYTTATGTTKATTVTADDNTSYYARFTTNSYNVTASAGTGGQVKAGTAAQGATSTASVKYKASVSLVATPNSGYVFEGWYTAATGGSQLSTSATYSYTLNSASAVTVYARFKETSFYLTGYLDGADYSGTGHAFTLSSGTTYTLTYKFTGGDKQYVIVYDGTNAYHPGSADASSGTAADTSKTDGVPAGYSVNKWLVNAPKGATVTFTWDSSTKKLSWTIDTLTLYLKPTSGWTGSSAWFSAYMFGNGTKWYKMSSAGNGYYSVEVDAKYPNVIFGRMKNTDTTTLSWGNCWNQTGDLTIPSDKNCYTVPSDSQWNKPGDGTDNANWSLY